MKISDILNEDERRYRRSNVQGRFHYTTTQKSKPPVTHPVRGTVGTQPPVRYGSYTGGSLAKSMDPPKMRAIDNTAMRRAAIKAGMQPTDSEQVYKSRTYYDTKTGKPFNFTNPAAETAYIDRNLKSKGFSKGLDTLKGLDVDRAMRIAKAVLAKKLRIRIPGL